MSNTKEPKNIGQFIPDLGESCMSQAWGWEEEALVDWTWEAAVARLARKTKKDAAPTRTVPTTPIKVKMLALRLRAMEESDLPKQAEQAEAGVAKSTANATQSMASKSNRFIGN
jgi:hypothetical protein